jgi:hypothetical protein
VGEGEGIEEGEETSLSGRSQPMDGKYYKEEAQSALSSLERYFAKEEVGRLQSQCERKLECRKVRL